MNRLGKIANDFLLLLLLAPICHVGEAGERIAKFSFSGIVLDEKLAEISGLAISRKQKNVLWAVNDSGNGAFVHAMSTSGKRIASIAVDGASNTDWEDIASFEMDGKAYLLIADTGDNGGLRKSVRLYVIVEPALINPQQTSVPIAWQIEVTYPDGARDCEAVAVDVQNKRVFLFGKKSVPAQIFTAPLFIASPNKSVLSVAAQQIATVTGIPQPSAAELKNEPRIGKYRAQISAADFSADGTQAVLLTYRDAYLYKKVGDESWESAFARKPMPLGMPPLPQPESVTFGANSKILYFSSERLPAPILKAILSE